MKKAYIRPTMANVNVTVANLMQASGQLNGAGVSIRNTEASGDAESRRGGSDWEDEE